MTVWLMHDWDALLGWMGSCVEGLEWLAGSRGVVVVGRACPGMARAVWRGLVVHALLLSGMLALPSGRLPGTRWWGGIPMLVSAGFWPS